MMHELNLDIIVYESVNWRLAKFCVGKHIKSEDFDSCLLSADYSVYDMTL